MISMTFESPYRALSAHLRRHLAENHISCRDWVQEIPEPMFRQLVADSLLRVFVSFVPFIVVMVAITWKEELVIGMAVGLVIVALPFLWDWRQLSTQCVEREFVYRRLFGKWRWEH